MRRQIAVACAFLTLLSLLLLRDVPQLPSDSPIWVCDVGRVTQIEFSPDDARFAAVVARPEGQASDAMERHHRQLLVLDSASGETLLDTQGIYPMSVCVSDDASKIAVRWLDSVRVYAVKSNAVLMEIDDRRAGSSWAALGFANRGRVLVTTFIGPVSDDREVGWNVSSGRKTGEYDRPHWWSGSGISRDGSMVYSGGWPGPTPRIRTIIGSKPLFYCFRHPFHIYASFTSNGRHFVTIHEDGAAFLWEARDIDWDNAAQIAS